MGLELVVWLGDKGVACLMGIVEEKKVFLLLRLWRVAEVQDVEVVQEVVAGVGLFVLGLHYDFLQFSGLLHFNFFEGYFLAHFLQVLYFGL